MALCAEARGALNKKSLLHKEGSMIDFDVLVRIVNEPRPLSSGAPRIFFVRLIRALAHKLS